jgi:sugar phosphate isomerase/epimerase
MDLQHAAIHTFTTKPWSIDQCIDGYVRHGFGGISIWRETIAGQNLKRVRQKMGDAGIEGISLVRGGFFTGTSKEQRDVAIAENLRAIQEAEALGLPMIVLVCGATPGQIPPDNIVQIERGIEAILPHAEKAGIKLAVEPLHPMYAGDRSAVCSLRDANDMVERLHHPLLGVAIDVYHVWWELDLQEQIDRCADEEKIFAFHVCDFKPNMEHVLLDRGLPGEGVANVGVIDTWVRDAGFAGMTEVEIFSNRYWAEDQDEFLKKIAQSLRGLQNPIQDTFL